MKSRRTKLRRRLGLKACFEQLECRRLLAVCSVSPVLADYLTNDYLTDNPSSAESQLTTYLSNTTFPLIGNKLAEAASPLHDARVAIAGALASVEESELEAALQTALENIGFVVASVDANCSGEDVAISLELSRTREFTPENSVEFEIGIAKLPFFSLAGDASIKAGMAIEGLNLELGLDSDGIPFFGESDGQFQIDLFADFSGTEFAATIGLLTGSLAIESRNMTGSEDDPIGSPLAVTMSVDLNNNAEPITLDAGAHFDLVFHAGGAGLLKGLPAVGATIAVDWFGPDALADPQPTVSFAGVHLEFGEFISKLFAPIEEHLGPIVDKVDKVFDILNTPIPGLKQLLDSDPTLLSILGLSATAGPPEYQAAVQFLEVSTLLVDIVDKFKNSGTGKLQLELGDLNLSGLNSDLRFLDDGTDVSLLSLAYPELNMPVLDFGLGNFDLDGLAQWATENLSGELGTAVSKLAKSLQNNPVQFSFPFLQNLGGSVFGLLLGQDVDFFRLDVSLYRDEGIGDEASIPGFALPGFSFEFGNSIIWDLELGLGLDTRGIRRYLQDVANEQDLDQQPYHFGDGFYITENTELSLTAGLSADFGVSIFAVAHGHVEAGVQGGLSVRPTPSDEWLDANTEDDEDDEVEPDKLYFRTDLGNCMGEASGGIFGFVDAWVGIGVQLPGGKFLGGKKEFHLVKQDLFKFGGACIPNPFAFDESVFEPAAVDEGGVLWLNIGPLSNQRGYLEEQIDESIIVEHVGSDEGLETVRVSFGGRSKEYSGVVEIRGNGGTGADYIEIAEGVTSNVELFGGRGPDVIVSKTTGTSILNGDNSLSILGGEDDYLEGGLGPNTLNGGRGNDELVGGPFNNSLIGGPGDDLIRGAGGNDTIFGDEEEGFEGGDDQIYGGDGSDTIRGGPGNDLLVGCHDDSKELEACSGQNTIHGDGGNDIIIAGANGDTIFGGLGGDEIHAGAGDDMIATYTAGGSTVDDGPNSVYWEFGDGNSVILNSFQSIDTVSLFGSPATDYFEAADDVSDVPTQIEHRIRVSAPGGKSVFMTNISRLNIDGLAGEDTIVLQPFSKHNINPFPLTDVGINLAPAFRDDGAIDHVIVNGTSGADDLTVDSEQVLLVVHPSCSTIFSPNVPYADCVWGGVMTVAGFPDYLIRTTNVADDLQVITGNGEDNVTVNGNTGPTLINTGRHDDLITVNASTLTQPLTPLGIPIPADFLAEVTVEAGRGTNHLIVSESQSKIIDQIHVDAERVWSQLLPGVNYRATGGSFDKLEVIGGPFSDTMFVHATHKNVGNTIVAGFFDPENMDPVAGDLFIVSSTGTPDGDLSQLRGKLTIVGHVYNTSVAHIIDRGATSGNGNVLVADDQISGFAGPSDKTLIELFGGLLAVELYGSNAKSVKERFTIDSPSHPVTVHGENGNDRVEVLASDEPVAFMGGAGDDRFHVPNLGSINATMNMEGGEGDDIAEIHDENGPFWSNYILEADSYRRGTAVIQFDDTLEQLRGFHSNLNDFFRVNATPPATAVSIDQGLGSDFAFGPPTENDWRLTGADSGSLNGTISFTSTQQLRGGSENDSFRIVDNASLTGSVTGGDGLDTLHYGPFATSVTYTLLNPSGTGLATNIGAFQEFEELVGSSFAGDRLVGFAGDHVWDVTANNAGQFLGTTVPIAFRAIEALVGASGNEIFRIQPDGRIVNINAGGGIDQLDYSLHTSSVFVDLESGQATGVSAVANVENVGGGEGDDILWGDAQNNSLIGGDGNDVLVGRGGDDLLQGRAGRDLLIGGTGSDTLLGESGEDILIGGRTDHDSNRIALNRIMAEWTSNKSFGQRVNNLMGINNPQFASRLNGNFFLIPSGPRATVHGDSAVDSLFGGTDRDWFLPDGLDNVLDSMLGDLVTTVGP